tara:strand:+ start:373 stop:633 length:261 start_codon:yes stop_codon:yes gene_type:complete
MEEIRILIIGYCLYGVLYCMYAVKVVLAHREVQLRRFKQIEHDAVKLNKLYLHLVSRCEETPREKITVKETFEEISRLKIKLISFC